MGEQVEGLKNHSDFAAHGRNVPNVMRQLKSIHNNRAPLVLLQAVDGADKGGLAGSGRTEDHDHFARLDLHTYATQRVKIVKPLVHVRALNDFIVFV
jgi:hypothetical protein